MARTSQYKCSKCGRVNDTGSQFCGACGASLVIAKTDTTSRPDDQANASIVYCNVHRSAETQLRCGRCDIPVCPKCMAHSPVGVRCPQCSKPAPMPQYDVQNRLFFRALGVAILMGLLGGFILGFIVGPLFGQLLTLISMAGWAYLLAQAVSFSANKKRGPKLTIVASTGILISAIFVVVIHIPFISLFELVLSPGLGIYVAYCRLR